MLKYYIIILTIASLFLIFEIVYQVILFFKNGTIENNMGLYVRIISIACIIIAMILTIRRHKTINRGKID